MKNWSYSINSLFNKGELHLEEAPSYAYATEFASEFICDLILDIPLPEIQILDDEGKQTTLREQHGSVGQLWHLKVCIPVCAWAWSKTKSTVVPLGYDKVREIFYEKDQKFFDDEAKIVADILTDDSEE